VSSVALRERAWFLLPMVIINVATFILIMVSGIRMILILRKVDSAGLSKKSKIVKVMAKRLVLLSSITCVSVVVASSLVFIPPEEFSKWPVYISMFNLIPSILMIISSLTCMWLLRHRVAEKGVLKDDDTTTASTGGSSMTSPRSMGEGPRKPSIAPTLNPDDGNVEI
jgi:hypothetical protein